MFYSYPYKKLRFPIQCIWLKLNGSWPLAESSIEKKSKPFYGNSFFATAYTTWAWYVIASVGITISYQTAFLLKNLSDIIITTENCCTTFMGVLNFVRLIHLRLNQRKFRKLIEHFSYEIWIPDSSKNNVAEECRKRMITFSIMTALLSCLIIMYCVLPLVELFFGPEIDQEEKPFPYKMVFPYNPYHNWISYALTYMFTSYAGICVVTTLFAEDTILGFFITYTCGQFRLLHERIDKIFTGIVNPELAEEVQLERIKRIVQKHNNIIRFAKRLEDFFNPILLVNLMISSVLICMVGFQIITGNNMFIGDYVKFIIYISSALSQLYVLCENGDALIKQSTLTAQVLYECQWEGSDRIEYHSYKPSSKRVRNHLSFMILCSQQPVRITAFKFSTLSLQSFTAILSTSLSYFTLLRSVYFDDENKLD
ncbi:odorant receptor 13a isoform X1 [Drosophila subpulchrella]|uniref:odorant receptor 13a isoform X1 n=1 Tax=Drosophila subpulchrella TaxID=1486046 RepID=UPI0018A19FF8|nr:odorant receptor 13a isoform X1 [Drosophila subpulchrella]